MKKVDFEYRILDFEYRILDFEYRILDFEYRILDFDPKIFDFELNILTRIFIWNGTPYRGVWKLCFAGNAISEVLDFKIYRGGMLPNPSRKVAPLVRGARLRRDDFFSQLRHCLCLHSQQGGS